MKVLFITNNYLNGVGGGVFASRAYINAFAKLADEMTLLYPVKDDSTLDVISPQVNAIAVKDKRNRIKKMIDLLTGRFNRFRLEQKCWQENKYDLVVFDTSMVVHGIINYFKDTSTKIITIHHNYQYEYYRDNTTWFFRPVILFWSRRDEKEAVQYSSLNLTLTEADKTLLLTHYGNSLVKIETIGTFEYKQENHAIHDDVLEEVFVITGDLSSVQTEKSLIPWIRKYYPLIKNVFPTARLVIAGRSPSDKLCVKAEISGISVIGSPLKMEPILAKAKYYICATSLGGGLKLRVMDGLKYGLPVLCHKVSARGYESFIEKGILFVYDDPISFKRQLIELKKFNMNKKDVISFYESLFSFDSGVSRLDKILTVNKIVK